MSEDTLSSLSDSPAQTDVAVYLGDCTGDTLRVVCDGTSVESEGTIWKRAVHALVHPSPRGPYPVSARFTIFVHETRLDADCDDRVLTTIRIDVECEQNVAYANIRSTHIRANFEPIRFSVGDDVVEISRAILRAAP